MSSQMNLFIPAPFAHTVGGNKYLPPHRHPIFASLNR